MSYEAWGDGDDGHEGCRTNEDVEQSFVAGAQAMRAMLARFVENTGDHTTAMSLRANWHPGWGPDPGRPEGDHAMPGDDLGAVRGTPHDPNGGTK